MNDFDPEAQALFDSVRSADRPTRGEKARIKRRVLARVTGVVLAASAGVSSTTTVASVATAATGAAWSTKLIAVAVASALMAGGAATGAVVSHRRALQHAASSATTVRSPTDFPPSAPAREIAIPLPPSAPAAAPPLEAREHMALHPAAVRPSSSANSTSVNDVPMPETLEQELPLLRSAQEALRLGQIDRALVLLDLHASKFPTGALTEERRGAHALAICRKGAGPAARAEAEAFVRSAPSSPLTQSVRSECLQGVPPAGSP
jgi:hypothetical protein